MSEGGSGKGGSGWSALRKIGVFVWAGSVLLFFLIFAVYAWDVFIDGLLRPFYGWASFIIAVLPNVTLNYKMVVSSLSALVVALGGAHFLIRRFRGEKQWKLRWTLLGSAGLMVLFGTSIAAIGIVHQIGWLTRQGNVFEYGGSFAFVRQKSDARDVVWACLRYAESESEHRLPTSLDELSEELITRHRLLYQSKDGGGPRPWIYLGADLKESDPDHLPVLVSPRLTTGGKRVLATLDGMSRITTDDEVEKAIEQWRRHLEAVKLGKSSK
jgi:hypothetical protein